MTRINFNRVLIGGLLAGLILSIGDTILNHPLLGEQWKAAMDTLGKTSPDSGAVAWFIIMDFIVGVAMVWLYAAIRPRFGAGPRTAVVTGLIVWFFASLWNSGSLMAMETFPAKLLMTGIIWGFFQFPLAATAGAWLYKEE